MSRENVDFIRRMSDLLAEEGYEAIMPAIAPDFEFTTPADMAAEPDTYHGREGIRRWYETFYDAMDDVQIVADRYIDAGDWVVVPSRLVTRGRHSGLVAEQPVVFAWLISEEQAVSLRLFRTEDEALEAVARESATG